MSGKFLYCPIHFVWSTANREPMIDPVWKDRMYSYIGGILREKKAKLICAGGVTDHVHLLVTLPSTITIADVVNAMKSNSSKWIHQTFPKSRSFAWQEGYGGFAVSKSAEKDVIDYIKNQEHHHSERDFKKEFVALLNKHEIEYKERYLWD